jgi:hypothetical protein
MPFLHFVGCDNVCLCKVMDKALFAGWDAYVFALEYQQIQLCSIKNVLLFKCDLTFRVATFHVAQSIFLLYC